MVDKVTVTFTGSTGKKKVGLEKLETTFENVVNAKIADYMSQVRFDTLGATRTLNNRLYNGYAQHMDAALQDILGRVRSGQSPSWTPVFHPVEHENLVNRQIAIKNGLPVGDVTPSVEPMRWVNLSKRTIKVKSSNASGRFTKRLVKDADLFFIHKGGLKKELTGNRGGKRMLEHIKFVEVTAKHIDVKTKRFVKFTSKSASQVSTRMGTVRIKLLPKFTSNTLPGLRSRDWTMDSGNVNFERMLGLDQHTLQKLGNTGLKNVEAAKRPLLQPIFTYYTLFSAPGVVLSALNNLLPNSVKRR